MYLQKIAKSVFALKGLRRIAGGDNPLISTHLQATNAPVISPLPAGFPVGQLGQPFYGW